jgi:hypothetical protein
MEENSISRREFLSMIHREEENGRSLQTDTKNKIIITTEWATECNS